MELIDFFFKARQTQNFLILSTGKIPLEVAMNFSDKENLSNRNSSLQEIYYSAKNA